MSRFAIVAADGVIEAIVATSSEAMLADNIPNGRLGVACPDTAVVPGRWLWTDGRFVPIPVEPPGLSEAKGVLWDRVRAARDRAEWWGCTTPLGRADTDPDSQRKVAGAVQMAMIAQGAGVAFSIDWTMQDNSSVTHDAAVMILLGVAVGQHVAACHAVALAKRAAIDGAADGDALAAVDAAGGWPDAPTG